MCADVLTDGVHGAFLASPPDYVVEDDLGWLDRLVRRERGQSVDSRALMARRLSERFDALRCCHATNVTHMGSYYERGLVALAPSQAHASVRDVFLGSGFPELTSADVDAAIGDVDHRWRADRVFFEVNERSLVADCGHYLLYGGEYRLAIAANLCARKRVRDYRQALKGHGTPTVFVCDVPLPAVADHLGEAAGRVLKNLFRHLLDKEDVPDPHAGFGFPVHRSLPPECIVGHYHPEKVRDPLG